MAQRPPDLVGGGGRVIGRGQPGGHGGVGWCAARMGCHVGHPRRMTCGPGRGDRRRMADLPSRRVRLGREGADSSDSHLAPGEGSDAVDGITRACVARGLRLEQRQGPLGAVGGPHRPVLDNALAESFFASLKDEPELQ
jgi:hypothetical protein